MNDSATKVGVGDAVLLATEGYPVPSGSSGAVKLECGDGLWLVDFGPGAEHLVREGHMAVTAKAPAPPPYSDHGASPASDEWARQRDAFLRDVTDGDPVSCGPLPTAGVYGPRGYGPVPSSGPCAGASCCGGFDEPDDSVTDDLRDLISSQSLAMATARTRQGVGYAAMTILAAAKGDEIGAAITRGLKAALGSVGDLFDGVDLEALVRQAMGMPAPQGAAAAPETVIVGVQIDGKTVGTITVPVSATGEQVVEVIRGEATLMAKIPADRNVVGVEYVPGKVVRITTAPVEAPAPAAE